MTIQPDITIKKPISIISLFKLKTSLILPLLFLTTTIFSSPLVITSSEIAIAQTPVENKTGEKQIMKIGVLAKRGDNKAAQTWQGTADYLSKEIPGYTFQIVPLDFQQITQAVKERSVDFVIPNSGMFVDFEGLYNINGIATLKNQRLGKPYTVFGGVIFRRKDREDIQTLEDVKGKTLMGVDETSLGGWQMQWGELKKAGIDPYKQLKNLSFGKTHDDVVYAVRDGKVDVGTVRTDTLERMAEEGLINLNDFVVINQQKELQKDFPFLLSTPLYPEWPFSSTKNTPAQLSELVASALLRMPKDSEAAKMSKSEGWTLHSNYRPVDDLFLDLQIGRYEYLRKFTLGQFIQKYWYWFSGGFIILTISVASIIIYQQKRTETALKEIAKQRELAILEQKEVEKTLKKISSEQQQQKELLEKEITQLIDELQNAVDGDLTVRASLSSLEMSTVADLFNAIIDSLSDIAIQVKESSTEVSSSLEDNEQSIQLLAQQAIDEAEQARNTLNSVEKMSDSIEEVANNAHQAADFAHDAYQETQAGTNAMDETVNSILNVRSTVAETAKKIKRLGESSQKIAEVVSLIEDIALKTNLLAINASVEASRAGEQGQGFTVVAEQVGALAEQSKGATKKIAHIVAAIQAQTQEVAQAMELSTSQVVDTTSLVDATKQRLEKVLQRSNSINELMKTISQSTVSQAETSKNVTELMQKMAQQSEARLISSEEIAKSIQATAEVAKQMESTVEQFKVISN